MSKQRSGLFNDRRAYCCQISNNASLPIIIIPPTVISSTLTQTQPYINFVLFDFTGSVSGDSITDKGVVWNSTGNPTITNGTLISAGSGSGSINIQINVGSPQVTIYATAYATTSSDTFYGSVLSVDTSICLAKGTLITLADLSIKSIENIDYEDELLVWNFDDGIFTSARPLWIKCVETTSTYNLLEFSDGSFLKTINQHRIFNKEKGMFTYPMTDDTPIGTTTFNVSGEYITLIKKEIKNEQTEYYNIITNYHLNMFANGILTSCRLNNIYPISNMMFIKEKRILTPFSCYEEITENYYNGLRLSEQKFTVEEIIKYVNRLYKLSK
jgi:hypothetical protein